MSVSLGGGALGIQKEGDVLSLETIIVRITSPFPFIGRHRPYIIPSFLFATPTPVWLVMAFTTLWKRLSPTQLNITIQAFSLIAIFFEGYDQGVMGGVNSSPRYVQEVGIGLPDGTVTKTTTQGGIVSIVSSHILPESPTYLTMIAVLSWCHFWLLRWRLGRRQNRSS